VELVERAEFDWVGMREAVVGAAARFVRAVGVLVVGPVGEFEQPLADVDRGAVLA